MALYSSFTGEQLAALETLYSRAASCDGRFTTPIKTFLRDRKLTASIEHATGKYAWFGLPENSAEAAEYLQQTNIDTALMYLAEKELSTFKWNNYLYNVLGCNYGRDLHDVVAKAISRGTIFEGGHADFCGVFCSPSTRTYELLMLLAEASADVALYHFTHLHFRGRSIRPEDFDWVWSDLRLRYPQLELPNLPESHDNGNGLFDVNLLVWASAATVFPPDYNVELTDGCIYYNPVPANKPSGIQNIRMYSASVKASRTDTPDIQRCINDAFELVARKEYLKLND